MKEPHGTEASAFAPMRRTTIRRAGTVCLVALVAVFGLAAEFHLSFHLWLEEGAPADHLHRLHPESHASGHGLSGPSGHRLHVRETHPGLPLHVEGSALAETSPCGTCAFRSEHRGLETPSPVGWAAPARARSRLACAAVSHRPPCSPSIFARPPPRS